jgi:eukaryotic-like serine/threonine-protein kinase
MERALGPGSILLGKYRVESVIGQGGMGLVLKVSHLELGEDLAVKVLLPEAAANPEVKGRFLREARSAARLRGEHVARVTDVGVLPDPIGLPFMLMEYLRGLDLSDEIARRITFPPGEAVDYVLQACEALAEAHAQGIVHRDIKPANLFLTSRPDGTPLVKVLDFGISKAPPSPNASVTKTEIVMGTPGYMSPEQMKAARDVDARADIWALGIALYEFLSGRRPFGGDSYSAILLAAATEPPAPMNPRVPRALQAAVLRCLEKDRRSRFQSVAELASALAPFARNRHEAITIVERTRLLLRPPSRDIAVAPYPAHTSAATTLSGSTGAVSGRSRRRVIAGSASLAGALVLLCIAALIVSGRVRDSGEPGTARSSLASPQASAPSSPPASAQVIEQPTVSQPAAAAALPQPSPSEPRAAPVEPEVRQVTTPVSPSVESTSAVAQRDRRAAQLVARCAALLAQRRWRDVPACASDLDAMGMRNDAQRLQAVAALERNAEIIDRRGRQAFITRNLKEVQAALREMPAESVYFKPLKSSFDKADALNVEKAKKIIQVYTSQRDCGGLKSYLSQNVGSNGTEAVVTLFRKAVDGCTEKGQPIVASGERSSERSSEAVIATPTSPPSGGSGYNADSPELPVRGDPDDAEQENHRGEGSGKGTDREKAQAAADPKCKESEIDAMLTQARGHFDAGRFDRSLALAAGVLECRQDIKVYRLAAMYACRAHDAESARKYFSKIPKDFQPAIVQTCQIENIVIQTE